MGELQDLAAAMARERAIDETAMAEARVREQQRHQKSHDRAMEFIGLMRQHGISPLTVYSNEVRPIHSPSDRTRYQTVGTINRGPGWIVRPHGQAANLETYLGLVLCENGETHQCWSEQPTPPDETRGLPDGPCVRTLNDQELDGTYPKQYDADYGNAETLYADAGARLLAGAILRYGIAGGS